MNLVDGALPSIFTYGPYFKLIIDDYFPSDAISQFSRYKVAERKNVHEGLQWSQLL